MVSLDPQTVKLLLTFSILLCHHFQSKHCICKAQMHFTILFIHVHHSFFIFKLMYDEIRVDKYTFASNHMLCG